MRDIDRLTTERYGIPSIVLMENAAIATVRCVTDFCKGDAAGKSLLVLCGKGNNGGDGAAGARLLATAGARVDVVLVGRGGGSKGDARVNFTRYESRRRINTHQLFRSTFHLSLTLTLKNRSATRFMLMRPSR